jgi:hypothetical protein
MIISRLACAFGGLAFAETAHLLLRHEGDAEIYLPASPKRSAASMQAMAHRFLDSIARFLGLRATYRPLVTTYANRPI